MSKAKFVCSSLFEAAKESAERHGIPTKRSYWKEHPWHALLTIGLVAAGVGTAACDLYVALDTNTYYPGKIGQFYEDVSFIPPRRHSSPPPSDTLDEIQTRSRSLNVKDILSFIAPPAFFALAIGVEKHNYGKWKKSIEKVEEESKTW